MVTLRLASPDPASEDFSVFTRGRSVVRSIYTQGLIGWTLPVSEGGSCDVVALVSLFGDPPPFFSTISRRDFCSICKAPTWSESALTAWRSSALAWLGGDFDFDEGDGAAAPISSMLFSESLTSGRLQFLCIVPKPCSAFGRWHPGQGEVRLFFRREDMSFPNEMRKENTIYVIRP